MQVSIAYAEPARQFWVFVEVPDAATVHEAIVRSGLLAQCPQLDLAAHKLGVYGKVVKPDAVLRPGDRVEVYRAITCDPQTVPRRDLADDDGD